MSHELRVSSYELRGDLLRWVPRLVIDLPTEADSHRCELDRSPGLRFVGAKRPSQQMNASGVLLLRSSTLTVAGAAPDLHRLPLRHQVQNLYDELSGCVKEGGLFDGEMTIC